MAFGDEGHGDGIDAVTGVLVSHLLSFKNMPKVTSAIFAKNLDTAIVSVAFTLNGAIDLIIETRPTAPLLKLVC